MSGQSQHISVVSLSGLTTALTLSPQQLKDGVSIVAPTATGGTDYTLNLPEPSALVALGVALNDSVRFGIRKHGDGTLTLNLGGNTTSGDDDTFSPAVAGGSQVFGTGLSTPVSYHYDMQIKSATTALLFQV